MSWNLDVLYDLCGFMVLNVGTSHLIEDEATVIYFQLKFPLKFDFPLVRGRHSISLSCDAGQQQSNAAFASCAITAIHRRVLHAVPMQLSYDICEIRFIKCIFNLQPLFSFEKWFSLLDLLALVLDMEPRFTSNSGSSCLTSEFWDCRIHYHTQLKVF